MNRRYRITRIAIDGGENRIQSDVTGLFADNAIEDGRIFPDDSGRSISVREWTDFIDTNAGTNHYDYQIEPIGHEIRNENGWPPSTNISLHCRPFDDQDTRKEVHAISLIHFVERLQSKSR